MRLIAFEDLLTLELAPRVDLIQGLLPRETWTALIGGPKVGKSYLALQLALAVAQGGTFLGCLCVKGTVLYLDIDAPRQLLHRAHALYHEHGVNIDTQRRLVLVHPDDIRRPLDVLTPLGKAWLEKAVRDADPALVILDVLRDLHRGDEQDSGAIKAVCDALTEALPKRTLMLLHHSKKPREDGPAPDPVNAGRGSSYLAGKVDAIWMLGGGKLQIVPRYDERRTYKARQDATQLWVFPEVERALDLPAKLHALCVEFPALSHHKLVPIALERYGVPQNTYYRIMRGSPCAHKAA